MPKRNRRPFLLGAVLAAAIVSALPASAQPPASGASAGGSSFFIPLHDGAGVVRAYMSFQRQRNGKAAILFVDTQRVTLNAIPADGPAPASAAAAAPANPLAGYPPLPSVTVADRGPAGGVSVGPRRPRPGSAASDEDGRSDYASDTRHLQNQISELQVQLQAVVNRLNAAAARR